MNKGSSNREGMNKSRNIGGNKNRFEALSMEEGEGETPHQEIQDPNKQLEQPSHGGLELETMDEPKSK